jgi:ceramide glucosyltransferase
VEIWLPVVAVGTSLGVLALMAWVQRRHLRTPVPVVVELPPVSILKPLKGADAGLADNLASFMRLDYPDYEVLFGVRDSDDPAIAVARAVIAAHPAVPARVVVDRRDGGLNPKVNNLANLLPHARHEVLLISDSNVRVGPGYLRELIAHLARPGVGLVSSPIRGGRGRSLGAALEGLQLNTFVMGGVAALHRVFDEPCVVGKSMLLRRSTLERIGGFPFLGRFLAEDQVCGQEVVRLGQRLALAHTPVDNVLGGLSVRDFLSRHLRWAKIRRHVAPAGYAAEALLNPLLLALAGAAWLADLRGVVLVLGTIAARAGLDAWAERVTGVVRPVWHYLPLVALRDLLLAAAWPVPFLNSTVSWRANRLRITRRSRLVPLDASDLAESAPAEQALPA